jgi:serine/threonine protein phosphatase PrpC
MSLPPEQGKLAVRVGHCSRPGRKPENQDFHGAVIPQGSARALKGVAVALADGISTSRWGREAAETAVRAFLEDYYATSEALSVRTAASMVIDATNAWLHARTLRHETAGDMDHGHLCTFAGLVLKGRRAHLFHVGDSRIHRLDGASLEPLTEDHRVVLSAEENYLARALGLAPHVEIDHQSLVLTPGARFLLTTDGVHEHLAPRSMAEVIAGTEDLDAAAARLVDLALAAGSPDNLTAVIVAVDALPDADGPPVEAEADLLPPAPLLEPPAEIDGYRLTRILHSSARSRIYLALEPGTGRPVALKVPSADMAASRDHLRRMLMEEWVAQRVASPHVLRARAPRHARSCLYCVMEHVEGRTLRQWLHDTGTPSLEQVRDITAQIAAGLRALHRREMVHQDLRPENVMIDATGTVRLIDFGAVRVAGVHEAAPGRDAGDILGTVQYTAPEYFLGETGTALSDQFSLGVIAYEMLTGRLPYGIGVSNALSLAAQRRLTYVPAKHDSRHIPRWMDAALARAVAIDPHKRYPALSELVADLRTPTPRTARAGPMPLAERDPVRFWQGVSLGLAALVLALLIRG